MGRPRYQRARLVGEQLVADLAQAYLAEVSQRLRPGSYKSVRFALSLLSPHLGTHTFGDLSLSHRNMRGLACGYAAVCLLARLWLG